jgi:hypothetical protein
MHQAKCFAFRAIFYAAVLSVARIPAFVARIISISRLNFSHLPLARSEILDWLAPGGTRWTSTYGLGQEKIFQLVD